MYGRYQAEINQISEYKTWTVEYKTRILEYYSTKLVMVCYRVPSSYKIFSFIFYLSNQ